MRRWLSALSFVFTLAFLPLTIARADAPDAPRRRLGGFVEQDLGVLLLFGGVGLHGGLSLGNVRAGFGFYRFKSSHRSLSGAPKGFDLEVLGVLQADVAWHPFSADTSGPYVRAIGQVKRQQAENRANGVEQNLDSALVGPEIGWVFRVYHGLYLAPSAGALYYAKSPQGARNRPIDVGGRAYDNPRHQTFDFYGTIGIGYAFD